MTFSDENFEQLRSKLRFHVGYNVGFFCPDVEDIVQEALMRFMLAVREDRIQNPEAVGAFLNGICRNVISEYRRKNMRDEPMPEVVPEPEGRSLPDAELLELRQAIQQGMQQLSDRDRRVLGAFYLEEKSKDEILEQTGLSDQNFRVILFRAKERFRAIYSALTKHSGGLSHPIV